jgi:hypothetical protein
MSISSFILVLGQDYVFQRQQLVTSLLSNAWWQMKGYGARINHNVQAETEELIPVEVPFRPS